MKNIVLLLGCLLLVPTGIHAGELYRWVDKSGKVHYSDAPAGESVPVERKKFSDTQNGDNLPYESRRAQQSFPVTLYTADNCIAPCEQARDLLNKRGIPFAEKKLLTQKEIDEFRQQSGSNESPVLAVGKAYLSGFEEGQWNSELDIAGYPKALRYRPSQAPDKPVTGKQPENRHEINLERTGVIHR